MKKRLALLLSVAMAFSMFANVAFGAENTLTTAQKYDELVKAGIFSGFPGQTDPQLNTLTDRAQFAKILALVAGLDQAEGNSFKDQNYGKHWAKGYIEAVVKAGYMNGVGNSKFDLKGKVTGEQMAKSFALALGLKEVADAPAAEGVTKWATGWVAAIKAAGFDFSVNGKWNVPAPRSVLVEAAYDIKAKNGVKVESAVALDEKTVEVTFSDKEKEKVTLDKALVEGQETTVSVTHKGKKYDVKVTLKALAVEAKVIGASTFEVKLSRTVDTAAAKFSIKRGATDVSVKDGGVKFSDDKLTAQVTSASKLSEGDYTVNLTVGDKTVSATAKVEAEKIVKVELVGEEASTNDEYTQIKVGYKVVNQYGEDASKLASFNWTSSKGTLVSDKNGVVTFETQTGTNKYFYNEPVVIMGQDISNGLVVNKTYKVGTPARAAEVTFKEVYNVDKKVLTSNTNLDNDLFYVLIDIKDQYGNRIEKKDVKNSLLVNSTNPLAIDVEQQPVIDVGPSGDSYALKLKNPISPNFRQNGEVTLRAVAMGNGKEFTHKITVGEGSEVKTVKLYQPEKDVAQGDKEAVVPFEALDQKGEKVTDFDTLKKLETNSGITFTGATLVKDFETGKAKLVFEPKDGVKFHAVSVIVMKSGASANVQISIKDKAVAKTVKGFKKDFKKAYGVNAVVKFDKDSFAVVDQYNRDYTVGKDVYVAITNWSSIASGNSFTSDNKADKIVFKDGATASLKAVKQGEQRVELALVDASGAIIPKTETSVEILSVVSSSNISSYEVKELPALYSGTGANSLFGTSVTQQVYLEVTGKRAGGESVVLNPEQYFVTGNPNFVKIEQGNDGVRRLIATPKADGETELTVGINGAGLTPDTIKVKVKVSDKAQAVKEIKTVDDVKVIKMTPAELAVGLDSILGSFKATDQYGISGKLSEVADKTQIIFNLSGSFTGSVSGNGSSAAKVTGAKVNDSITLTVALHGGYKNVTIQVVETK